MATNIVGATGIDKVQDGIIVNADIDTVAASKLTGALPAISGASLTNIPAGNLTGTVADARISALTATKLTGALPAISAANLTSIPAANITGTLPAISAANLTSIPAANITGTLPAISGANLTGISSVGGATGVDFNDNVKVRFGTDNDGEMYHTGSQLIIKDTSSEMKILATRVQYQNASATENIASFNADGAVELYYNNSKKLETQSGGLNIWGDIEMGGHFAFTGESGSDRLTIREDTGAVWIDGNCSAASFTDRTPYPETLQLAYDVINSHQKLPDGQYKADDQSKQLDHSNLHEYVSLTTPATLWTENHNLPEGISVGDVKKEEEKSRNMSGVISCLVEVIKDLSAKIETLENA